MSCLRFFHSPGRLSVLSALLRSELGQRPVVSLVSEAVIFARQGASAGLALEGLGKASLGQVRRAGAMSDGKSEPFFSCV